jgi:DNA-binding beta-propeller fold protein YncE
MHDTVKAIALDKQGRSLVLDGNKHIWRWEANGNKSKDFDIDVDNGNDIAVNDADGTIYVAHSGGLTKYNAEGDGAQAIDAGDVRAVAAHKDDLWAIVGNKVQKLSADGSMVMEFGPAGSDDKTSAFTEATDVAVDARNGNLVVVDKGAKNVYVYDSVGTLIGKVGQGVFDTPVAATVDAAGKVYVVDAAKKKVYEFMPAGMR